MRKQLNQAVLPVWCDDSVFSLAMGIVLSEPKTFKKLFVMLGPFHWTKVLLCCAACLFAGSGIDNSVKECEVFSRIVLNFVMSWGHVQSMIGILMIKDVIYKVMCEELWIQNQKSSLSSIGCTMKVKEEFNIQKNLKRY